MIEDENNIYSILFRNNHWSFYDYLNSIIPEDAVEGCLNEEDLDFLESVDEEIVKYYRSPETMTLKWTDWYWIELNYEVIDSIIDTIKWE